MEKKDKIDDLLTKFSKEIREEIIPSGNECPNENLLLKYINKESTSEEKESIEEHLSFCDECLETLEFMRMSQQVENEAVEIPEKLYINAQEILQKELKKSYPSSDDKRITPQKIVLLWDKLQNKITHLQDELEAMITMPVTEAQAVRDPDPLKKNSDFPYHLQLETRLGSMSFEFDHGEREGYLTLSISSLCPEHIAPEVQVRLYKAGISRATLPFAQGRATFHRLKVGTYRLEFFDEVKSIEIIDLPIKATNP